MPPVRLVEGFEGFLSREDIIPLLICDVDRLFDSSQIYSITHKKAEPDEKEFLFFLPPSRKMPDLTLLIK